MPKPVERRNLCCGLRPFGPAAWAAHSKPPQHGIAGSGLPWRLSLAGPTLALCPFSIASLMPASAYNHGNLPALPPMPASASAWRLILSSRRAPLPCWACTSRRPASYVGSNRGGRRSWALARLSFALELQACLGSAVESPACLSPTAESPASQTLKLPDAPLDGPETMASPGN